MIIPKSCRQYVKMQRTGGVDYSQSIEEDYESIHEYLPEKAETIWDIGCGIAGIDVPLYHRYEKPLVYLTDYSRVDKDVYYNFHTIGSAYNNLGAAADLLTTNGVMWEDIRIDDLGIDRRVRPMHADIVISLLSCGFHYPVDTYFDEIVGRTSSGSVLILDIRKGAEQRAPIARYFETRGTIEYRKYVRYVGIRRKI